MVAHVFVDGEVATKANLESLTPGRLIQSGSVRVVPVANVPTTVSVVFPRLFPSTPLVFVTPATTVCGSQVKMAGVTSRTVSGFTATVLRTNTTTTTLLWQAWGLTVGYTTAQPAYASLLNQAGGAQLTQSGRTSITPVANTPTYITVTFATPFAAAPSVVTTPASAFPGTAVKSSAATDITTTSFKLWVYRTNNTATDVCWIATGRL
ncbi:MAG: hypothetical protein IPJ61_21465 [Tessaracoccus sp.]|uniref:hypothetical protein n=1 Tax=Tessaracoccus sp. TaxID=1971211 RepID=UPI001ED0338E|nr:hypothetical protein [Tessaracoccus sp.]MBK7823558.1 hypothetical protein [Tessaracoccus sp.]